MASFEKGLVFGLLLCAFMVDQSDAGLVEMAKGAYETIFGYIMAANEAFIDWTDEDAKAPGAGYSDEKSTHLYQGDIDLDPDLFNFVHNPTNNKDKRNAVRSRRRLWLSRIIPYDVPKNMEHIRTNLLMAIREIEDKTCIRFVPYNGHQKNYIYFHGNKGCSSKIGKMYYEAGKQGVSIGNSCNHPGTILHELLHTLGFWHEQSRPDRDKYVKINYENIQADVRDQFDKYDWKTIDELGKDYDYNSIMHYDRHAFSANSLPTIEAINDPQMKFGNPKNTLSVKDVIEINALYDCSTNQPGWTEWSEFTPCDNDGCMKSRERYCYHPSHDYSQCRGANAYGIEKQSVVCTNCPEPFDGHWGNWGAWTQCSKTCDDGTKTRTRLCNNPAPAYGGTNCPGDWKEEELCTLKRCILGTDDTDFENKRMGMWTNSKQDNFDWSLLQGFSQTVNTGAHNDHTSGHEKGFYLYTESSAPRVAGDKAKLTSPWMPYVAGGQCIKFAYTMYGKTIGTLGLKMELKNRNTEYYIFYKKGDQGSGWKTAMGNIDPPTSVGYRLTFEATLGDTGYSDFAIDDVYIDPGKCDCQDEYVSCKKWAVDGECLKNAAWMAKHCKRSCKKCNAVNPTTILVGTKTGESTSQLTHPVCIDTNLIQCPLWADKGECTLNPKWMNQNCRKSCEICGCYDSDSVQCPLWAAKGICKINPVYMLVECVKSCNVCRCHDNNVKCLKWASSGECTKNPRYMNENCKRSCKICK